MTAPEKAKELFEKMKGFRVKYSHSKKCAKIAVVEITKALTDYGTENDDLQNMDSEFRWWDEVKSEIEKL